MSAAASRFSPGTVTVAVDGLAVDGTVHAADPTLGLLIFELSEPAETAPTEGSVVRILRGGPGGSGAQAELIEVEDEQRWVLGIPSDLSPAQQRGSARVLADGAWQLHTLDAEGDTVVVDLFDLSAGGVGLQFPAGAGPDRAGRTLDGRLVCERLGTWTVSLTSTNVRRHPDDPRLWIVGCKVQHASDDAAASYRALLADLA